MDFKNRVFKDLDTGNLYVNCGFGTGIDGQIVCYVTPNKVERVELRDIVDTWDLNTPPDEWFSEDDLLMIERAYRVQEGNDMHEGWYIGGIDDVRAEIIDKTNNDFKVIATSTIEFGDNDLNDEYKLGFDDWVEKNFNHEKLRKLILDSTSRGYTRTDINCTMLTKVNMYAYAETDTFLKYISDTFPQFNVSQGTVTVESDDYNQKFPKKIKCKVITIDWSEFINA